MIDTSDGVERIADGLDRHNVNPLWTIVRTQVLIRVFSASCRKPIISSGQVIATLLRATLSFDGIRRYKPLPLSINVFTRDHFPENNVSFWVLVFLPPKSCFQTTSPCFSMSRQ